MLFTTRGQFLELLACVFGGIIVGIIYDILHFFSLGAPDKKYEKRAAFIIADILFALFSAAVFIIVTYLASFGEIRGYTFLGFFLGFLCERHTIKIFVAKAARTVYNYLVKIKKKIDARRAEKTRNRAEKKLRAKQEKPKIKKPKPAKEER